MKTQLRYCFIGNANNYPFRLALALRRQGESVTFVIDSVNKLDRPENSYPEFADGYPDWVKDMGGCVSHYYHHLFPKIFLRRIVRIAKTADVLIVNGLWPIFAKASGKPYYVILTGSDLGVYCDPESAKKLVQSGHERISCLRKKARERVLKNITSLQSEAIRSATAFNYLKQGMLQSAEEIIEKIKPIGIRTSYFFSDIVGVQKKPLPNNRIPQIICGARINWVRPLPPGFNEQDYKGTDILVRGFAKFLQSGGHMQLTLVRKGLHILETERLIKDLGIGCYVSWVDEMSQSELLDLYAKSDIVIDHFGVSAIGMAGVDAMALGRPVIAASGLGNCDSSQTDCCPICHAATPNKVCAQLTFLSLTNNRKECGDRSTVFVRDHVSAEAAAREISVIFGRHLHKTRRSPRLVRYSNF